MSCSEQLAQHPTSPLHLVKTTPAPQRHSPPVENADLARRSSLYKEFVAEREEILRHKWIESEKLGRDIGFERALVDWLRNHREKWRETRKQAS